MNNLVLGSSQLIKSLIVFFIKVLVFTVFLHLSYYFELSPLIVTINDLSNTMCLISLTKQTMKRQKNQTIGLAKNFFRALPRKNPDELSGQPNISLYLLIKVGSDII